MRESAADALVADLDDDGSCLYEALARLNAQPVARPWRVDVALPAALRVEQEAVAMWSDVPEPQSAVAVDQPPSTRRFVPVM